MCKIVLYLYSNGRTMINKDFSSIIDFLESFRDEQICISHLELLRWNGKIVSPFDENSKIYFCKYNKYRCRNTGKYFNVRTGTMFDNTKIPLQKWFLAIWLITSHKKGISSVQLAKDVGVTQKTAWFLLQRIRNCFDINDEGDSLSGTVEADETFVGGKNKNRHKDKKVANSQGRSFIDKTPVLGLMERKEVDLISRPHKFIAGKTVKERIVLKASKVLCRVIPNTQAKNVQPFVKKVVQSGSKLITDEWHAYTGLNSDYDHYIVNHATKEYVNPYDNSIHSNSIEGFWTWVKKSISGIYHQVSRKHLQKYADECAFRYNTIGLSETQRFNKMLSLSNRRLTYKMLISCS